MAVPLQDLGTSSGAEIELRVSKTCPPGHTDLLITGQTRPLLRFQVTTSLSCPTGSVGSSCPGVAPELANVAIVGTGNGMLT